MATTASIARTAAAVAADMKARTLLNFADRSDTVSLLKAMVRRCSLVITNDTGARHVAAALGAPVVTLFGSTDPRRAEINYPKERIIRLDVPCSPCQQKMCPQPAGPLYHQCMEGITPEMVFSAAAELLVAGAAKASR
jgi:heptosyltransferase-2